MGLDIGTYSIKLAVCGPNRKDVETLSELEIFPERKFIDQSPGDSRTGEKVAEILSPCLSPGDRARTSYHLCVQGEGEISGYAELPRLKPDQEDLAVKSIARKSTPYTLQEAVITYKAVPPIREKKEGRGIFFIAMRKRDLDRYGRLLEACGLTPDEFTVSSLAVVNAHRPQPSDNQADFSVLVNCGYALTTVIVIRAGSPYFMRSFALAGANFTYAFQMGLQQTWQESQKLKNAYDVLSREVFFEPVLGQWLEQVKKSIDGFKNVNRAISPQIDRIYLTGGSAQLGGLDKRLAEFTGSDVLVEAGRPVEKQAAATSCAFAVARGAILKA